VKGPAPARVDLVVLDQGIDTATAIGRMFFQILGSIAKFEHRQVVAGRGWWVFRGPVAQQARGREGIDELRQVASYF
jgi:hypothetical protein